jgi:hypothetical protein
MGIRFWEVVCDEHGIGGGGEYCGESDAHLDRINVFYLRALGGKYVARAMHIDIEPGVIGAVPLVAALRALPPGKPREPKRGHGKQLGQGPPHKGLEKIHPTSREVGVVKPLSSLVRDTRACH